MIGPRKKRSIAKKRQQKHMWMTKQMKKLTDRLSIVSCKHCDKKKLSHRVCPHCGWYKGQQVMTISTGSKQTVLDA
ncbi:MAG: 50S ribosomal protein L32 [Candidatus Peribacteria bacterium]|nr:MAG: 50S ribosomal protein L32 [Candidatus Peribacteria bacterium]